MGMYVYLQLLQCNSMLVYVYPSRLCNKVKICPDGRGGEGDGRLRAVWPLFGRLAAHIAHTAVLVCYAKDKGAFITARQRVGQTIKDLRHSEYAHGHYISLEMP